MEIAKLYDLDTTKIPDAPADNDSTENPGVSGPSAECDYGQKGEIFFDYPSEAFTFERKFGVDSLKSNDETIKISFVASWDMEEYEATMEGYDIYVADSEGVTEEGLTFGGFEATRVTWADVFGDISMETYILFGEGKGQYVGINVIVTGSQKAIDSNMAVIETILNSVRLKNG